MPRSAALPRLHTRRGSNFLCHDIAVNQVWGRLCRFAGKHRTAIGVCKITFSFSAVSFRLPFFTLPIISNLKRLLLWQMLYQIICQICAIPELNKVIRIGNLLNFVGELSRVWLLREVNMRVCHVTSRNFIFHADYAVVNLYHMGRTQRTTPNDLRFTDRNRCPEKLPKLTIALP